MDRPLVYYAISFYIGCLCLLLTNINFILSLIVILIFIGTMFFTQDIKAFILITVFFIMGSLCYYFYFNLKIDNKAEFRILENIKGEYIADYSGKKVILNGNINYLKSGKRIIAIGKFCDEKDYSNGVVGRYEIIEYYERKKDILERLYDFKDKLYNKFSKILGKKGTGIVMACCYGDTQYLSFAERDDFKKLGISHIISVSGFHLAVVYKFLEKILGIKCSLIVSFIYVIFTGSKAATLRAYIMILMLQLSKIVYRNYDSLSAISLAALLLLIIRPYYILDVGFILSFLSTIGIVLYNKKIQKMLYKLPKKINESLSITLSAQIFSMPYSMCVFNNVSLFFIPANLLLIPLFSIIILIGNLAIIATKVDFLFEHITYILKYLTMAIDGGLYLLLKISPNMEYCDSFYGITFLFIYTIFIFIKKGYSEFRYFLFVIYFVIIYRMI